MDKKAKYTIFRHILNLWTTMVEEFKKDAIEILKENPIDLEKFYFGQQPYHFISVEENLYPRKAYLDKEGFLCVDATWFPDGSGKTIQLGWDDMVQDMTTLSDFMDCVYDNVDLKYDNELETKLENNGEPCQYLAVAGAVLNALAELSANNKDHQDVVNFLAGCAGETDKWKEVKRLANDKESLVDWDKAIEKVQPMYFPQ